MSKGQLYLLLTGPVIKQVVGSNPKKRTAEKRSLNFCSKQNKQNDPAKVYIKGGRRVKACAKLRYLKCVSELSRAAEYRAED